MAQFYERNSMQQYRPQVIFGSQMDLLNDMASIFHKQKTDYRIVISPLYDQLKLNAGDLETLRRIFGTENVYDFSGINEITKDYHNYYENSHYRPHVCTSILDEIYKN